ncbi:MAG: HAD-IA family hydrolase, partial [Planctomycetota bacterium]|nr:HAD-IA family hydrolase [Planctomycetota bacterium]
LLVFDLGRVMINLCRGWADACRRADVAFRPELESPERREPLLKLLYRYETGRIGRQEWAAESAKVSGLAPAELLAVMGQWLDAPITGWDALLDDLQAWPGQTACLSNTHELHWELMHDKAGRYFLPLDRLHHRFASHLIGAHKPEPAIYEHVERAAKVKPAEILFFDDAPANVKGALARGWRAVPIDITGDAAAQVRGVLRDEGVVR